MFIGRQTELEFLNEKYNSDSAEFIFLYGRRRVGKTELLSQFCAKKRFVYYACNEYTDAKQLQEFSDKFLPTNPEAAKLYKRFTDWSSAFRFLAEYNSTEKTIVVIDEFPYMAKANKSIPSILQNLWDHTLRYSNIMLILSGSSMSFMENEILAYKNPLYGRATGIIKLKPLQYYDAIKFFPDFSDEDKAIAYAILGGIPHYLKQFNSAYSLEQNIKRKLLTKGEQMYEETEFILRQELREPAAYITIIEAIALGCNKFTEIASKSCIDSSKLTPYLKNLIELGLVEKQHPALSKTKDTISNTSGEYVIADNYFKFYYSYIYPHKAELDMDNIGNVWDYCINDDLHSIAARPFEEMCITYMYRLSMKRVLPIRGNGFARWWGKVTKSDENGKPKTTSEEIDIISKDYKKDAYIIGECKFTNDPFDMGQLKKLQTKLMLTGDIYYYLFSLNGFTDAVIAESNNNSHIVLVTLSDILSV